MVHAHPETALERVLRVAKWYRMPIGTALDNLETVLRQAGMSLKNVVRLNYYTTNIPAFFAATTILGPRLQSAGIQPAGTLLGVASLFHPDILVEIEATAVD
jgi:enamine deaminase RidA (YjgF/YER057c/UK114 family)